MTNYTVRVELHDADEDDYATLHAEMEERGFVRWIAGKGDAKDRLPTAEYNLARSQLQRSEVLKLAQDASNSAKPSPTPWILVTESAGRSWSGLKSWRDG
jgi:hypothetical protein